MPGDESLENTGRNVGAESGRRTGRTRRRGGGGVDSSSRTGAGIAQVPWQRFKNMYAPMEPLSADQVETIHDASLSVLENSGIEVMNDHALDLFKKAGAKVDFANKMVYLDRGLVEEQVAKAPSEVTITPRNPDRWIRLGGNDINFAFVSGAPNIHDRINGRRAGNWEDFVKCMKFAQSFNCVNFLGNQVAPPIEMPVNNRHLDTYKASLTLTDKVFSAVSIGHGRCLDHINMVARARGMSVADMENNVGSITNINVNSPRKLDNEMCEGAMTMAEYNQATIVTPFTLMGAMTPITMAAALTQGNAEALIGIVLTQLVRPGAPVLYGTFTSNVDMKSGAPTFGTPENSRANLAGGQMARRYNLPQRTSACNASNAVDGQATYETMMALWSAVMAHGNIVMHSVGWLEGGLVASFEKMVLDAEMIQHVMGYLSPIDTSPESIGLETIDEVAPGGHFFGSPHTMERYETAFYAPFLSDWTNNEAWLQAGGKDTTERATELWQQILRDYEEPVMDPSRVEALDDYIAKRKEEIGSGDP